MELWHPAYVGVGSNLDDPRSQVVRACNALREIPRIRRVLVSRLYASRPLGPIAQPDFVNAVAGLLTQLDSLSLLRQLRAIEQALGRPEHHEKWGPRVIDLDILVFGSERRTEPELTVPHPHIVERNFVLYPLADIAPDLEIPGLGRVSALQGRVGADGLRILA